MYTITAAEKVRRAAQSTLYIYKHYLSYGVWEQGCLSSDSFTSLEETFTIFKTFYSILFIILKALRSKVCGFKIYVKKVLVRLCVSVYTFARLHEGLGITTTSWIQNQFHRFTKKVNKNSLTRCTRPAEVSQKASTLDNNLAIFIWLLVRRMFRYCKMSGRFSSRRALRNLKPEINSTVCWSNTLCEI